MQTINTSKNRKFLVFKVKGGFRKVNWVATLDPYNKQNKQKNINNYYAK